MICVFTSDTLMMHMGRHFFSFFREAFAACVSARDEEEKHEEVRTYTCQSQVSLMNKEAKNQRKPVVIRDRPAKSMKK